MKVLKRIYSIEKSRSSLSKTMEEDLALGSNLAMYLLNFAILYFDHAPDYSIECILDVFIIEASYQGTLTVLPVF